ncbi:MAG: hypothetical protein AMJ54_01005 [Deltaproteobacteria bacterium SG8_13]|nr:MAG: hypothetical protein AMJ54_01005 [Deltaproteobacteria bacterium SG8_13]
MVAKARSQKIAKFAIYMVVVVLVNFAAVTLFYRIDLTANRAYSISAASRQVVSTLTEPLTINVFFTRNLPAPHNNTERYLRDLLEEYAIYANRYFNYRFYDVSAEQGDVGAMARSNQELARSYGINPIQIQVIDEDQVKFQQAYMGLVILHGDLIERIPTITATDQLEYQLTTSITKLNRKISALMRLQGKIDIKLFLSSSLKQVADQIGLPDLMSLPQKIEEAVKQLNPRYFNLLEFRSLDPSIDGNAAEELESKKYNVLSLRWPNIEKENIAAGTGSVGLVLEHAERNALIPMITVLRLPIIGTRYQMVDPDELENLIAESIESLIDINEDIGYLADKGTLPLNRPPGLPPGAPQSEPALTAFRDIVSRSYSIKNVSVGDGSIPSNLGCLVVARPVEKFTDYELFVIDQYLMGGGNLALFLDAFNEIFPSGPQGMGMPQGPRYVPLQTGIEKLLEHYGLRIRPAYVMDKESYRQELPDRMGGGDRPIYFAPLIQPRMVNHDLDFMKNIKSLVAVKVSPVEAIEDRVRQNELTGHRLFSSSERSWEMRDRINLNPELIFPPQSDKDLQSFPLAYLLEGEFPSYFEGKSIPVKTAADDTEDSSKAETDSEATTAADQPAKPLSAEIESQGGFIARGKPGKIFLIGSSEMIGDNVIDPQGQSANAVFIMNVIDALNSRSDIAVMRAKRQQLNPLDETGPGTRTFVKAFNIAGLPVLVVSFGIITWFRRASRKRRIQEMFQR